MRRIASIALFVFASASSVGAADRVVLDSGDVLIGTLIERTDERVIVEHALLGRVDLPAARVVSVTDADATPADPVDPARPDPSPQTSGSEAPAAPPAPASPIADAKAKTWLDAWDLELALGFDYRDADADTLNINAAFAAAFADERDRWKLSAAYFVAQRDGERHRDDLRAFVQKDWLFPESPWFLFAQGEYQHDDFKSWEHRVNAHAGVGFDLKPVLGIDARLRGGAGVTHEFGGTDPDARPESLVGSEFAVKVGARHTLAADATWYPAIDGSGDYRLVTTASWTFQLTQMLGLRVGARNEYDSSVPDDFEPNDLRVFGSLVFKF